MPEKGGNKRETTNWAPSTPTRRHSLRRGFLPGPQGAGSPDSPCPFDSSAWREGQWKKGRSFPRLQLEAKCGNREISFQPWRLARRSSSRKVEVKGAWAPGPQPDPRPRGPQLAIGFSPLPRRAPRGHGRRTNTPNPGVGRRLSLSQGGVGVKHRVGAAPGGRGLQDKCTIDMAMDSVRICRRRGPPAARCPLPGLVGKVKSAVTCTKRSPRVRHGSASFRHLGSFGSQEEPRSRGDVVLRDRRGN